MGSWFDGGETGDEVESSRRRMSVSSPDETPRRELKIRRSAEYF